MATYAFSPGSSVPTLQVTTPTDTSHTPRLDAAMAFTTPCGSGSLTMTFVAALGPVLLTTIWYAIAWFGAIVAGATLLMPSVSSTSTVVVALALLLPGVGSGFAAATRALLVTSPARVSLSTRTTSVMVVLAPTARSPSWQLTPPLHRPCVGVALTKLVPAGSRSTTLTSVATAGPLFVA